MSEQEPEQASAAKTSLTATCHDQHHGHGKIILYVCDIFIRMLQVLWQGKSRGFFWNGIRLSDKMKWINGAIPVDTKMKMGRS